MSTALQIDFDPTITDLAERIYKLENVAKHFHNKADLAFQHEDGTSNDTWNMLMAVVENLNKEIAFNQKQIDQIWNDSKNND